jgi:hypothetical protein
MTETNESIAAVSDLIQERRKYEGWLNALDARQAQTPPQVFDRVRADYQARLAGVIERIGEHTEALAQREESLTARLSEIAEIQLRRRDERCEAELRAHVGEITAEAWDATAGEIDSALAGLEEERAAIDRGIADVRELLAAAHPSTARSSEPPAPDAFAAAGAGEPPSPAAGSGGRATPPDNPAVVEAAVGRAGGDAAASEIAADSTPRDQLELPTAEPGPPDVASASRTSAPVRRDSFDELAFLKTVTGLSGSEPPRGPASSAAEPRQQKGATQPFPGAPRAPVRPPADESPPPKGEKEESVTRGMEPKAGKTLKCAECGSLNYPTEWYCERCGAELAAL